MVAAPACAAIDDAFYGPPEDHSRFISAHLLEDGRTCLFAFRKLVYRPPQGLAAFPDGGVPKYLTDHLFLAVIEVPLGQMRVLGRLPNRDWVPDSGDISIQSVCGPRALLVQGGQRRHDYQSESRWYWLDVRTGQLQRTEFNEALGGLGRASGAVYLLDPEGLTLHWTTAVDRPTERLPQNPDAELWLRYPDGRFLRVGSGEYYGCSGTRIYFYDLAARHLTTYDWVTGARAIVPGNDADYVAGLNRYGVCPNPDRATVGCSADRLDGLRWEERRDDAWQRTPITVDLTQLE